MATAASQAFSFMYPGPVPPPVLGIFFQPKIHSLTEDLYVTVAVFHFCFPEKHELKC